jgi:hypothetical protein
LVESEAEQDAVLQEQLTNAAFFDCIAEEDAEEEQDSQPRNSVEQEYPHLAGEDCATADPYGLEEDSDSEYTPFGGW